MSDLREDGTRRIAALETDLFFTVKIQDTLKRAGFQTRVARTASELGSLLSDGSYALALINTAARGVDWRAGVAAAQERGVPVIAYGPHVDLETQSEARAAGATRVIANSRLTDLPAIVERVIVRASERVGAQDQEQDKEPDGSDRSEASDSGPDGRTRERLSN